MSFNTNEREIAEARAGIQEALANTLAALRRKAPVEEVADLIFTNDVVIAVPGEKTWHGMPNFMSTLSDWITWPIESWTIEEPIKASGNLAAAYILEKLYPQKDGEAGQVMRSLWVFEKGPAGWRCSREAFIGETPDVK